MRTLHRLLLCLSCLSVALSAAPTQEEWQEILANAKSLPEGREAPSLAKDLLAHMGNPDPLLRDAIGYTLTARWVQQGKLNAQDLSLLLPEWQAAAEQPGPEAIYSRSFGTLHLALAAALDAHRAWLSKADVLRMMQTAERNLRTEKDLRGWDARYGWVHIAAHTADLVKNLARSPHLEQPQQDSWLEAVGVFLKQATCDLRYGEERRLAQACAALASRDDFPLERWRNLVRSLQALPEGFEGIAPRQPEYWIRQNAQRFLAACLLELKLKETPGGTRAAAVLLEILGAR